MLQIKFSQPQTEAKTALELVSLSIDNRHGFNKIAGTALNKLFKIVDAQSATGRRVFHLNKPIQVQLIRNDKILVDTMGHNLLTTFSQSLKLNKTAKSKRRFAEKFMALRDLFVELMEDETVDVSDLLEEVCPN